MLAIVQPCTSGTVKKKVYFEDLRGEATVIYGLAKPKPLSLPLSPFNLSRFASLADTFVAVCYGSCKIAHPWTGGGEREDVSRVRFTNDWASRPGIQRSLWQNPAAASIASLYQATRLSEHQLGLGRDGRR